MNIVYKTKKHSREKDTYSLIVRLTKEDFDNNIIKEVVLKIKIPSFLNWSLSEKTNEIRKEEREIEGRKYDIFEIRKKDSLYPQDTPLEIIGPNSDIGEILYSVTDENHQSYLKENLLWELYGDGVSTKSEEEELKKFQNF